MAGNSLIPRVAQRHNVGCDFTRWSLDSDAPVRNPNILPDYYVDYSMMVRQRPVYRGQARFGFRNPVATLKQALKAKLELKSVVRKKIKSKIHWPGKSASTLDGRVKIKQIDFSDKKAKPKRTSNSEADSTRRVPRDDLMEYFRLLTR